jgi:hypothetical protein
VHFSTKLLTKKAIKFDLKTRQLSKLEIIVVTPYFYFYFFLHLIIFLRKESKKEVISKKYGAFTVDSLIKLIKLKLI